jgi:ABC-type nitrate/sulfonate/bicarbonate transport system substrate-binding protein
MKRFSLILCLGLMFLVGCSGQPQQATTGSQAPKAADLPCFSLAISEYPSWSVFLTAQKMGLIKGKKGEIGPLEEKYGVDIEIKVADYDPCLTYYGNGVVDAVCMTNIDSMNPCSGRPGTAILPTSTSAGADAVISTVADDIKGLKGVKTHGLSKSVSEYVHYRGVEKENLSHNDYPFVHLDPGPASTALQQEKSEVKAVCVWNPFKLTILRKNPKAKVIFTSKVCPLEVIDMVVMGNDSLKKPKGEDFAALVCDIYYKVAAAKDDPKTADQTLKALGEDFCDLPVADMRICCTETSFFGTPAAGIELFSSKDFQKTVMPKVVETCKAIKIIEKEAPSYGFNDDAKQLNFSTKYMERARSSK